MLALSSNNDFYDLRNSTYIILVIQNKAHAFLI